MKKKILVTGSQGYIGSILVPKLITNNFDVSTFDTGFFDNSRLYDFAEVDYAKGDMRNFDYEKLNEIDTVVHLASIANDPFGNLDYGRIYNPITSYSYSLAEQCKKRNIQFIWPSSCSVYGIGEGVLTEESSIKPQTPYSQNKADFEKELEKLCDSDFIPIVLRLCTLYGLSPRIRFDLVANMFAGMAFTQKEITLNSDGQSWRPLVHIEDVCNVIINCIEGNLEIEKHKSHGVPLVLNVGISSENYKIIDVAKMASKIVKDCKIFFMDYNNGKLNKNFKDQNIKGGVDVRTYVVSFDKLSDFLPSFKPEFTLEKGLIQMINKFAEIKLTYEEFTNYKYYRLKTMDYLFRNNRIDEDLFWR